MTPINIGQAAAIERHPIDSMGKAALERLEAEVNARSALGVTANVVGIRRVCMACDYSSVIVYETPVRFGRFMAIDCLRCHNAGHHRKMPPIECIEYPAQINDAGWSGGRR